MPSIKSRLLSKGAIRDRLSNVEDVNNNMKQEEILQQLKDGRPHPGVRPSKGIKPLLLTRPLIFLAKNAMDFQKSSMVKENAEQLIGIITAMNEHKRRLHMRERRKWEASETAFPDGAQNPDVPSLIHRTKT